MKNTNSLPDNVKDEYGNIHQLGKFLAQGAFGAVYRLRADTGLAIKIAADNGVCITDLEAVQEKLEEYATLRILKLPANLKLTAPIALLSGYAGYVMYLLQDMIPFGTAFLTPPHATPENLKKIPVWLKVCNQGMALTILEYIKSGGLRRRLSALSKAAAILARIHGAGLVYADISENNLFVSNLSDSADNDDVWYIDPDNLWFESDAGIMVGTPGYWAPEIENGWDYCSPASDVFAFAVLAYRTLTLIFPFDGVGKNAEPAWYEDDNPDRTTQDLPWVDDPDDASNRSRQGIPREWVLNAELFNLFRYTFSEGKNKPDRRPAIYYWPEAFARAADETIYCDECGMSFYYEAYIKSKACPFCGIMIKIAIIKVFDVVKGEAAPNPRSIYIREITAEKPVRIPSHLLGWSNTSEDRVIIEISLSGRFAVFRGEGSVFHYKESKLDPDYQNLFSVDAAAVPVFKIYVENDRPAIITCEFL